MPDNPSNSKDSRFQIIFEPLGRRVHLTPGKNLLEAAQEAGVDLSAICGGMGQCGACRVRLAEGRLSPPGQTEQDGLLPEDAAQGYRLACQAIPLSDCRVDIPLESLSAPQRLQVEGQEKHVQVVSPIAACDVRLEPPSLVDLRSDLTRLRDAVAAAGFPAPKVGLQVLETMSDQLRQANWLVRAALRGDEMVAVLPLPTAPSALSADRQEKPLPENALLGLAVDIGTTKMAAYLVELNGGQILARAGAVNPQVAFGEDVISRIHYANQHSDGGQVLQQRVVETLNQLVGDLCRETGAARSQVVEAVVVGNTAMHHLFAGLPVRQLGASPYVPSASDPIDLRARDIGLEIAPGAYVYLPPNVAGYVGADHVAMLVSVIGDEWLSGSLQGHTLLAVDIGTNTEISLWTGERLYSCSAASGPAFEGAHISEGMRAAPGAVDRVQYIQGELRVQTIEDKPAVGICGSGILDAVSALLEAGLLDRRGNLSGAKNQPYILVPAGQTGHGRDLAVSRKDISEIQLAKGAIRAAIDSLLVSAGMEAGEIQDFVVAGAFGTYLSLRSAVQIGMFPELPLSRFRQVGNAAGDGARQMLVSLERRRLAFEIARQVEYLELTIYPGFSERFTNALMFTPPVNS